MTLVEGRDEESPASRLRPVVDARLQLERAAAAREAQRVAIADPERLRVGAIHLDVGVGRRAVQRRDALSHRARAGLLEDPAGLEPEGILAIRHFRRRLVRAQPDPGAMIRVAVEVEVAARSICGGIVRGVVAPPRFPAVHEWPEGAPCLTHLGARRQAPARILARAPVLVPGCRRMSVAVPRKEPAEAEPARYLDRLPTVAHRLAGRYQHLLESLDAPLRVREHPLSLEPHRRRQHHVRGIDGRRRIGLGDDETAVPGAHRPPMDTPVLP